MKSFVIVFEDLICSVHYFIEGDDRSIDGATVCFDDGEHVPLWSGLLAARFEDYVISCFEKLNQNPGTLDKTVCLVPKVPYHGILD